MNVHIQLIIEFEGNQTGLFDDCISGELMENKVSRPTWSAEESVFAALRLISKGLLRRAIKLKRMCSLHLQHISVQVMKFCI